jgi:hypothetical protein
VDIILVYLVEEISFEKILENRLIKKEGKKRRTPYLSVGRRPSC